MIASLLELIARFNMGKGSSDKSNSLIDKFNAVFSRDFKAYLKSLNESEPLSNILCILEPLYSQTHLLAPQLHNLVVGCTQDYLRSYNISGQIAFYLFKSPQIKPETFRILLDFNLDRERLEKELRKFSCISYFDR